MIDQSLPDLLYGTAWKEERTRDLVQAALEAGFRGFDTANQRKHYLEAGVGEALACWLDAGNPREDLFIQTKFTFAAGQDHRLPYDPRAPVAEQVAQSAASSLEHLGLERIDSLVLHGPSQRPGLGEADRDAWGAMEQLHGAGVVGALGVSNVTLAQLRQLWSFADHKPRFVQNRCYARLGWDREIRGFCREHGVIYQGFSLLTANKHVLIHPSVYAIARRHERTPAQVIFRFAQQVGMLPLTGTTDPVHMASDLAASEVSLQPDEIETIEALGGA
ncbi:MAG TPA: aldo/keto reductase [Deltaproteobacteria bacterium]|nr:aldo/keto reductase [Deltaproteobacteria bacterium]